MVWDPARQDEGMLAFTRGVIALRRDHEVLRRGTFAPAMIDDRSGVYAFLRENQSRAALVILNRSGAPASVALHGVRIPALRNLRVIWPSGGAPPGDTVHVPAASGVVLEGEK